MNSIKKISFIFIIIALFIFTGFAIYTYETNSRLNTAKEVSEIKTDVLNQILLAFDIEREHYYICDIENINGKLIEFYKDHKSISKLIYDEYYNEKYKKASPTIILINKNLDDIILGFINKDNEKVCSTISLNNNGEWERSLLIKR